MSQNLLKIKFNNTSRGKIIDKLSKIVFMSATIISASFIFIIVHCYEK